MFQFFKDFYIFSKGSNVMKIKRAKLSVFMVLITTLRQTVQQKEHVRSGCIVGVSMVTWYAFIAQYIHFLNTNITIEYRIEDNRLIWISNDYSVFLFFCTEWLLKKNRKRNRKFSITKKSRQFQFFVYFFFKLTNWYFL